MSEFIITEAQINFIIQPLGEMAAKLSFDAITLLKTLPVHSHEKPAESSVSA